jgi:hypothetical protein
MRYVQWVATGPRGQANTAAFAFEELTDGKEPEHIARQRREAIDQVTLGDPSGVTLKLISMSDRT